MSLLSQILAVAHRAASARNGGRVLWEQDGHSVVLEEVTFGRAFEAADDTAMGGTVRVEYSELDLIFPAADLVLNGVPSQPADGARVTILDEGPGQGDVYEAMPIPGANCYRSCDPQGVLIRVHAKQVKRS